MEKLKLAGEWMEPSLVGVRVGGEVLISFGTMVLYQFDSKEPGPRDIAIAAMLRAGIRGNIIARIAFVSPAHVSGVLGRVARGGTAALFDRSSRGRWSKVTKAQQECIRHERAKGTTIQALAARLGLAPSIVGRVAAALPAPLPTPQQRSLPLGDNHTIQAQAPLQDVAPVQEQSALPEPAPAISDDTSLQATASCAESTDDVALDETPLLPGIPLPVGPTEHPCRYAGTLLLCAAAAALGVFKALESANVQRSEAATYPVRQVVTALIAAWGAELLSLEAMHERDARALGVVLGLERSPSVRTLHRAIRQMTEGFDPVEWQAGLLRGVAAATERPHFLFGVDGHFKPYTGTAPIDKGYDTKRRAVVKGIADVRINDAQGWTWSVDAVAAGDALSQHLCAALRTIQAGLETDRPIVLVSDRGGFAFETLNGLARDRGFYISYVPALVKLNDLSIIAPTMDGASEVIWTHARLQHPARLIIVRDDTSLIPIATNLPTLVPTDAVVEMLRDARGWQENSIRAARAFVGIDRLNDRGGATRATDNRLVVNPVRTALKKKQTEARSMLDALKKQRPVRGHKTLAQLQEEEARVQRDLTLLAAVAREVPARVARNTLDPEAQRAWLKTRNRSLLGPLKHAADNARRWLLSALGPALAPSDAPYDQSATPRTLRALLQTAGTVRLEADRVVVTLELPLPPTAHNLLTAGLEALDERKLLFSDGERLVIFRLAARPTHATLPSTHIT